MADYIELLKNDLVEQFRGKANIEAIMEAIGIELQQVADFYEQLRDERGLHNAVGKQLDGVGDIAVLSRQEATRMARSDDSASPLEDEAYRKYLYYKIWMNTNDCTYRNIISALRMFYDKPIRYIEEPDYPATIMFETELPEPDNNTAELMVAPIIKPAGVAVMYRFSKRSNVVLTFTDQIYKYQPAYCGAVRCGTIPEKATVGMQLGNNLVDLHQGTEYVTYQLQKCGTLPEAATVGHQTERFSTSMGSALDGSAYSPACCGGSICGSCN